MNLLECLASVEDPRRAQGRSHELAITLLCVIMATMSGCRGYRAIGDFMAGNAEELIAYLRPKKGRLPTFYTIRRLLQRVNFEHLNEVLINWGNRYEKLAALDVISFDGKAIGKTMRGYNSTEQKFVMIVSAFAVSHKRTISAKSFNNGKQGEQSVVLALLHELELDGLIVTADALHCQKKQYVRL